MKSFFAAIAVLFFCSNVDTGLAGFDRSTVIQEVKKDLALKDSTARRLDQTISAMIDVAVVNLIAQGFDLDAARLDAEYNTFWRNYITNKLYSKDLGDHEPLSEWLAEWYDRLELLLGPEIMAWTHLDDIKVINFAIPVTFDPRMESGNWRWDEPKPEYKRHFVPLAGVVTYWSVYIACTVATSGAGGVVYCGPLGMVSENVMVHFIAPPLSDRVYDLANRRPSRWD